MKRSMCENGPISPLLRKRTEPVVARIERRQWWLSSSAILVTLLLAAGVASFALPPVLSPSDSFYPFFVNQTVRGLWGLVLIFNVYAVYEQWQINRIRRELSEELHKLAFLDPLTNLFNRRYIEQRLADEIARSQRQSYPLTVTLVDLDALKQVNDTYGHSAGDRVLREFAERLKKAVRGSDLVGRYGGDEFLAVLPECTAEGLQSIFERLNDLQVKVSGVELPFHYSAGWTNHIPGESTEELLKRADTVLYVNKHSPKRCSASPIAT
jgi:diguanylate cyclase (GGDEF)-like protein